MGFRFTLYSTWCVVSRAPRGPRERWLQVLDGMRRQRAAYVRVPTGSCELNFVGMPFMSGGKGDPHAMSYHTFAAGDALAERAQKVYAARRRSALDN